MKTISCINAKGRMAVSVCLTFLLLLMALQAFAHGGKTHGGRTFISLEALQEATGLFDRLIDSKKIDPAWGHQLIQVNIETRNTDGQTETVVSFRRAGGTPDTLFIYFDAEGKYSGSNFTGE